MLKPKQEENKLLDRQKNILAAAGLLDDSKEIATLFKQVEARAVDLDSGRFDDAINPCGFDQKKASKDPATSRKLTKSEDIAGIGRREKTSLVYLVRDNTKIKTVILPIRGYGLWSTLYGYLAVQGDGKTVVGLTYYEHAETPGLGGEVDNPAWKALWPGKQLYDASGKSAIQVIKGKVDPHSANASHQVDGLAGATLTSRGVQHMFTYWLGEEGYGPFLRHLREHTL